MGGLPPLLCSASPRRAALLREAGIAFERGEAPGVDETPPPRSAPEEGARAVAERKARAAVLRHPGRAVISADTVVVLDGAGGADGGRPVLLGKPRDAADARRILALLSGRAHRVVTGVAVARDEATVTGVDVATVVFRALSPAEIEAYVATGEPLDKAGAYAIQGGAGDFVARLDGEIDTVVGLPISLVRALLARLASGPGGSPADGEG